jgi:flagella basal body P-ring formation protein FlgA
VRVHLRGGRDRTVFVPVTISALADVAVATRRLSAGDLVTAADVRWERRPVDDRWRAASPIGQEVSAPIDTGEVVDDTRLTAPPPVARGSEVRVEIKKGAITVVARGRLEQATRVGAAGRIRTAHGTFVTGTLVDRARVVVEAP